jgi:hypothetical protein
MEDTFQTSTDANLIFSLSFQYYEMSYGLNVEMHKQVSMFLALQIASVMTM